MCGAREACEGHLKGLLKSIGQWSSQFRSDVDNLIPNVFFLFFALSRIVGTAVAVAASFISL